MRFFSNDARESTDDPATGDRPERVQSEPVAVPGQRPQSPWSDAPGEEARDNAPQNPDDDPDRTQFHEPSPQPTAFGAATVGGAVAASATANPINDRWDATDRTTDAASGVADDRSVAPGDGVADDRGAVYGDRVADDRGAAGGVPRDGVADDRGAAGDRSSEDVVDVALDDRGTFDDPQVKDAAATRADDAHRDDTALDNEATHRDDATLKDDAALKDEGGFEDPKAVDPVTEEPLAASEGRHAEADETPAEAAPVAAAPAPAAANEPDTFFAAADAQALQERWRDVQLRFVDSPKEATTEAAALVDEAVEKLAAGLRSRKDGLGGESDDTETLRVQLRGYRDILNRILGL
ncbi:hypothetical protein AB0J80_18745 [Actinoplanes sp. NPDC049548]|uniref:hypothetical protein n=1 Tax=Actinoplanes sp. NPDC049548 TaxID=3155152 RepID=UPI0034321BCD